MVGNHPNYVRSPLGHANVSITFAASARAIERIDDRFGDAVG